MSQSFNQIPDDDLNYLFCCYVNATSQIQIARISNIDNWYFERVVFPGQRLMFEAPIEAYLEIHTGMMATSILSDTIPCTEIVVMFEEDTPVIVDREESVPVFVAK